MRREQFLFQATNAWNKRIKIKLVFRQVNLSRHMAAVPRYPGLISILVPSPVFYCTSITLFPPPMLNAFPRDKDCFTDVNFYLFVNLKSWTSTWSSSHVSVAGWNLSGNFLHPAVPEKEFVKYFMYCTDRIYCEISWLSEGFA